MKTTRLFSLILILGLGWVFLVLPLQAEAVNFPKYGGYVNDFAEVLTPEEELSIETLLTSFEAETSNEVVVVTVKSLEGLAIFDYSQELFMQWGIGKKGKNNGILFLIAPGEREAFLNVGKGLEGALPDSLTDIILRNGVKPHFKEANYAEGIKAGLMAITQAVQGEYTADPGDQDNEAKAGLPLNVFIIAGFFLLTYLGSFLARSKSWWLGGVFGGAGGIILGFLVWTGIWIFVSGVFLGGLGLLFDYVVSKNYQDRLKKGKPTDFWRSGGGFWWGGGFGGRGGGGGFGGFGGGISGGGGAGMKW